MITIRRRFMIRLALAIGLGLAAMPAQASIILDTGPTTFSADGTQFGRLLRDGDPSNWAEQKVFPGVTGAPAARSYDLYLLTGCDAPFIQDGLRDGEHLREWMTRRFAERLAERPEPHLVLSGAHRVRLERAAVAVDALGWRI